MENEDNLDTESSKKLILNYKDKNIELIFNIKKIK